MFSVYDKWCNPYITCCNGTCCDPNNCQDCNYVTSSCESVCDPDLCQVCDGQGNCEDCSRYGLCYECIGGYCLCMKECCEDSDCPNPSCQECIGCQCQLKAGAECAHTLDCAPCYDCVNCQCEYQCASDECCDNVCVKRCIPEGGATCTWTNPPVVDPLCEVATPEMPFCINPDKTCDWEPVEGPYLNAACADCDPGCTMNSTHCVVLRPVLCYEGLWPLPPFYKCQCIKTPATYEPEEAGTRYICPP